MGIGGDLGKCLRGDIVFSPPTVLIHMSLGFLWLALALSFFVLLPTMCVSFPLIFHRLQKVDLAFSVLSFGIGKCLLGGRGSSQTQPLSLSLIGFGADSLEFQGLPWLGLILTVFRSLLYSLQFCLLFYPLTQW